MQKRERYFIYREHTGDSVQETSIFSGSPITDARKAARTHITPAEDEENAKQQSQEIELREQGTDTIHIYEAWTWTESQDEAEWLPDETKVGISKKGQRSIDASTF
jgi:hypothetical protein